jgi:ethanolamine utilization cobalamin adenosyltransferase
MESKRLIYTQDVAKPLTRLEIAEFITLVDASRKDLTSVAQQELGWFKEEFWYELKKLGWDVSDLSELRTFNARRSEKSGWPEFCRRPGRIIKKTVVISHVAPTDLDA